MCYNKCSLLGEKGGKRVLYVKLLYTDITINIRNRFKKMFFCN